MQALWLYCGAAVEVPPSFPLCQSKCCPLLLWWRAARRGDTVWALIRKNNSAGRSLHMQVALFVFKGKTPVILSMFLLDIRLKNASYSGWCWQWHSLLKEWNKVWSCNECAVKKQSSRTHRSMLNSPSESHCWNRLPVCCVPFPQSVPGQLQSSPDK